jgi:hypothetical protein
MVHAARSLIFEPFHTFVQPATTLVRLVVDREPLYRLYSAIALAVVFDKKFDVSERHSAEPSFLPPVQTALTDWRCPIYNGPFIAAAPTSYMHALRCVVLLLRALLVCTRTLYNLSDEVDNQETIFGGICRFMRMHSAAAMHVRDSFMHLPRACAGKDHYTLTNLIKYMCTI